MLCWHEVFLVCTCVLDNNLSSAVILSRQCPPLVMPCIVLGRICVLRTCNLHCCKYAIHFWLVPYLTFDTVVSNIYVYCYTSQYIQQYIATGTINCYCMCQSLRLFTKCHQCNAPLVCTRSADWTWSKIWVLIIHMYSLPQTIQYLYLQ